MTLATLNNLKEEIWVVIPAYCEEQSIKKVASYVCDAFNHVIVVDDGSSDLTFTRAQESGATVIRHAINCGQGAAIQTGIKYAYHQGAKYIATFDADGQHNLEDLRAMAEVLIRGRYDIVLGSRFIGDSSNLPFMRTALLKLAVLFTWITSGVRLSDAHNGLRVMTSSTAIKLNIQQNKMAHASEIISLLKTQNLKFTEHPVTILYTDYSLSKGQKIWHSLEIVKELIIGRLTK